MSQYVVIDLEMTGLQVKTDRILEIGAVKIRDDEIAEEFRTFVNPHRKLGEKITELTGITSEMVEHAPEEAEMMEQVIHFQAQPGVVRKIFHRKKGIGKRRFGHEYVRA